MFIAPNQRYCGNARFGTGSGQLAWLLLDFLNQPCRESRSHGVRRRTRFEIAIQLDTHSFGHRQRTEKFLIELRTPGDVQSSFACFYATNRHQAEGSAISEILALQENALGFPVDRLEQPALLVAETRRPLSRTDDTAVRGNQFEKIERLLACQSRSFVDIAAGVGLGSGQVDGHSLDRVGIGDGIDAPRHFLAAPVEFALEFGD